MWVGKGENRRSVGIFWCNRSLLFPEKANNIGYKRRLSCQYHVNDFNMMLASCKSTRLSSPRGVCHVNYHLHNITTSLKLRALPSLWTWEAQAYLTFLKLKSLRVKAWLLLILYSRFALVLVRSLRWVSNCREKSRKKDEERQWTG